MSPQADVRASGADILSRTGNPLLLTLTFPADFLDGKTWSAAFGSTSVTPVVVGDVMTLALTGAQTTSLGNGKHTWTLTDTTGDDVVMVSGRLLLGTSSTDSPDTAITVQVSPSVEVAVSVVAAGVDLATVQDLIDDLIGGAPGALDTLNELAAALGDDANFAATVTAALAAKASTADLTAEAALARNADNLTSGTVADARIASTIARDSEVTAAIAAQHTADIGTFVPMPSGSPAVGEVPVVTDDSPLTLGWGPGGSGGGDVVVVGTFASPTTDPDEPRPVGALVVLWIMDEGVVPNNAVGPDLIWTENGPVAVTSLGTITKIDGPMTQAAYDALTPDADTLYVIVG